MLNPAEIAETAENVGVSKASLPLGKAFILAVMAGFYIGLGATFMLVVKTDPNLGFGLSALLGGVAFALGLTLVLIAGAELFTGNNLMTIGLLSKKYSVAQLLSRWGIVYLGNFVGSILLALILFFGEFYTLGGGAVGETIVNVAAAKAGLAPAVAFFRGILCNVLVCLAVWMGFSATSVTDKFISAVVPVAGFVACGYEHCVANMFFIPLGLLTQGALGLDSLTVVGMAQNIVFATLGNIVGGALFVAASYWFIYRKK